MLISPCQVKGEAAWKEKPGYPPAVLVTQAQVQKRVPSSHVGCAAQQALQITPLTADISVRQQETSSQATEHTEL